MSRTFLVTYAQAAVLNGSLLTRSDDAINSRDLFGGRRGRREHRRDAAGDWSLLTTIENPLPDAGLEFGAKLALDNGRLLIGARSTSVSFTTPTTPGAAFLFVPVPEPSAGALVVMGLGVAARWRGRR